MSPGLRPLLAAWTIILSLGSITPAPASFFSGFDAPTYADGLLGGQDGWTESTASVGVTNTAINGRLTLTGGGCVHIPCTHTADIYGQPYIIVEVDQMPGTGTDGIWSMGLQESFARVFCRWSGSGTRTYCAAEPEPIEIPGGIDVTTRLRAVIDLQAGKTHYYYDKGAGMIPLVQNVPNPGGWASDFVVDAGGGFVPTFGVAYFDNLSIVGVPEPASLMLLGVVAAGCLWRRSPGV